MSRIKLLPPSVIAKIAAGEVIERPAYAVKELLDNSIDANADFIHIELEESGLKKILISDNGEGMTKEDLVEAFKLHTTSKITDEEDLIGIRTKGFRGEALASIAAISNLTIKSKTLEMNTGNQIELSGGQLESLSAVGMQNGTTIIVENLFHTVPVRKKFLKHLHVEYRKILETVTQYAIAHSEIGFTLTHNKKVVFTLQKKQSIEERIIKLLGDDIAKQLVQTIEPDVNTAHSSSIGITVNGYISKPQLTTTSSDKEYIFINQRPVSNSSLKSIIKQSYGSLLDPYSYPVVILYITLPYQYIDVNVHPRKETVQIQPEQEVKNEIQEIIRSTLAQYNLTFHDLRWNTNSEAMFHRKTLKNKGMTQTLAANILQEEVAKFNTINPKNRIVNDDLPQFHNLYLISETEDGLVLIDQHAAHERILYEEYKQTFSKIKNQTNPYNLDKPILLHLSVPETQTLTAHLQLFTELGFTIEEFGINTFKITTIPDIFRDRTIDILIHEMIEDLIQQGKPKSIDIATDRMLTYLACRTAIKSGDELTTAQRKELLTKLALTPNQYTCPHGRPTQHFISIKDLEKMFKRR